MYIVIVSSLLCLLLTFLEVQGKLRRGMTWGFVLITLLGCIHYDYGNDYISYYELYKDIEKAPFNLEDYVDRHIYNTDPGWAILCVLFQRIGGFFMLVAVCNIFINIVYFHSIRKNVPRNWWLFSTFIYLFCNSYYLLNFSMMRQGLAVAILLSLWSFIEKKKWWIAFPLIYCTTFIHASAIVFLPFAFWGYIEYARPKLIAASVVGIFLLLFFVGDYLNEALMLLLTLGDFELYTNRYGQSSIDLSFGVGFIIQMIPFILCVKYLIDKDKMDDNSRIIALSLIGLLVIPFTQILPMVSRITIFFSVFSILAVPIVYSNIRSINLQKIVVILYVLITLYGYYLFFINSIYTDYYSTFHTIFPQL